MWYSLGMETIYRVENKKGFGCYYGKCEGAEGDLLYSHFFYSSDEDRAKHPLACEDEGIDRDIISGKEIFGFLNIEQARAWFTPSELNGLAKLGYALKKVIVQEITAIGEKQVLAIR